MPDKPRPFSAYVPNLATPRDVPSLRFWVQNELQRVGIGLARAYDVIVESLVNVDTGNYADYMHWAGQWSAGAYRFNDVVLDNGWTMVCINAGGTTDKAAPEQTAPEEWVTDSVGTVSFADETNSNVVYLSGQNYTFATGGFVLGLRLWTPEASGNFSYELWIRDGTRVSQVLSGFTPQAIGWNQVNYNRILAPGVSIDVVAVVRSNVQANSFNGFWQVKNENGSPGEGEAIFQNNETEIRVHKTDENDTDQTANLEAVETGGTLSFAGLTWTITLVDIRGSHVRYSITPNLGRPTEEKYTLTFSWGFVDPVPFVRDAGFFSGTPDISGIEGTSIDSLTTTNDAHGVDILVAPANVSDDWDIVSPAANVVV